MAITFVGSNTGTGSGTTTITIPMPTGVATGDVVYVAAMSSQTVDVDCTESSGTWTEIADLYSNDTDDTNLCVFRKVMGGTPDTDVTLTVRTTTGASVGLSYALRGVDTTTPEDATATTATSPDASKPNPPSITTVTANAWVIAIGGSSEADAVTNPPTDYSNLAVNTDGGGLLRNVMMASREIASPGPEDPGVFDDIVGTASDSWCAVSVAVRPAASGSTYTLDADAASYTYSATDAALEHGYLIDAASASYTYTANDATLTRDIPLVADSAAYTYSATDAAVEHGYLLDADSAAYTWTATDAALEYTPASSTYTLAADAAAYLWTANDASLDYVSLAVPGRPQGGIGPKDYERRVRAWWDRLESLQGEQREREARETEIQARVRDRQMQLAQLERRKRVESAKSAAAKRRAKLATEIADLQAEQRAMAERIVAVVALILQIQTELAAAERERVLLADRRRRMVLLLALAG
jgi:hypothetical protein